MNITKRIFSEKNLQIIKQNKLLAFLGLFYIVSVFIGAYRFYSPVPAGDMWEGYINFYLDLLKGDNTAWFNQHNEHRLLLSRLFFFVDLEYFSGLSRLLIPLNVFLLVSCWAMLLVYVNKLLKNSLNKEKLFYFIILLTVFSFSWKQDENIIWAFQSQFWFAYLLPLMAFYFLAMSEDIGKNKSVYFLLACLLGIASVGSMANGILVLPVMFVLSLLLKQNWKYSTVLFFIMVIGFWWFMADYQTPQHDHSILKNLKTENVRIVLFFIEYLGSPLKSLVGSFLLGLLHLYLIIIVSKEVLSQRRQPLHLSVLAFIAYYLIGALLISTARVDIGLKAALVGRYTTPTIISLLLSLILYFHLWPKKVSVLSKKNVTIIAVLMLGTQARTLIKNVDKIHDGQRLEAMQLELGISNKTQMQNIADKATAKDITIFALPLYKGKRELLGTKLETRNCIKLQVEQNTRVKLAKAIKAEPEPTVYVVDTSGKVIGFGLSELNNRGYSRLVYDTKYSKILAYQCR